MWQICNKPINCVAVKTCLVTRGTCTRQSASHPTQRTTGNTCQSTWGLRASRDHRAPGCGSETVTETRDSFNVWAGAQLLQPDSVHFSVGFRAPRRAAGWSERSRCSLLPISATWRRLTMRRRRAEAAGGEEEAQPGEAAAARSFQQLTKICKNLFVSASRWFSSSGVLTAERKPPVRLFVAPCRREAVGWKPGAAETRDREDSCGDSNLHVIERSCCSKMNFCYCPAWTCWRWARMEAEQLLLVLLQSQNLFCFVRITWE